MPLVKVGTKHQVVIPKAVRTRLGVKPGDYVEIVLGKNQAIIKPKSIVDRWTDEPIGPLTRAGIKRGLKDAARGRVTKPKKTAKQVRAHLDKLKKK